ncbi:MAG TPA: hypothetical protein VGH73_21415 [Thermoanaerobaculia bacterium]|jgi:Tfp pilus assembly protein PilN
MSPETPDYSDYDTPPAGSSPPEPAPPRPAALATPGRPLDRVDPLNLAGRPFLNTRPVVRVSLILWALGLALLLGNVSLFWSYLERSADKRAQIARGEREIALQQHASRQLQTQLDQFDLEQQNQKVDFLNKMIQERTFSWSTLLDRIAERLPNDVRLNRLAPLTGDKAEKEFQRSHVTSRRGKAAGSDQVTLAITGQTRKPEALLQFVDNLFHPPFAAPDPSHEETEEGGSLVKFDLSVQYRPGPPPPAAAGGASPAPRIEELPAPAAAPPRPGGRP